MSQQSFAGGGVILPSRTKFTLQLEDDLQHFAEFTYSLQILQMTPLVEHDFRCSKENVSPQKYHASVLLPCTCFEKQLLNPHLPPELVFPD